MVEPSFLLRRAPELSNVGEFGKEITLYASARCRAFLLLRSRLIAMRTTLRNK